ncbi:hypothetical protein C7S18_19870 [Ahniella affigens]|uniref:Uncharacterized protein n=1 Tax=Ahniella affigens TaxID=2021234 RepID=A0A2P1PWP8_9GAMM|nr:hypothetical protein [Ahniella affigens]AVP99285.1 hypothetical protein C7S18_19870 [Ahniella affigens]
MKRLIGTVLVFTCASSSASQCIEREFDADGARNAESVVLFQITSANLEGSPLNAKGRTRGYDVVADVAVAAVLRGEGDLKRIRYVGNSTHCGEHFDVGAYYFGFGSIKDGTLRASIGNVLYVLPLYEEGAPTAKEVKEMISGEAEFPEFFLRHTERHLRGIVCQLPPDSAKK